MFCPHCGAQNNDSATVCAECGQPLKTSVVETPVEGAATPPPFGEPNAPPQTTPVPSANAATPPPPAPRPEAGARQEVVPAVGTDEDDDPEAIDTGATILLGIAAFLVPLLGIILYFVWHPTRPRTARQLLMIGLINIVLLFGLYRYAS
jgi:hypothetical protein